MPSSFGAFYAFHPFDSGNFLHQPLKSGVIGHSYDEMPLKKSVVGIYCDIAQACFLLFGNDRGDIGNDADVVVAEHTERGREKVAYLAICLSSSS